MLRCTQRSDNIPPATTPQNDESAMVMVDIGPASAIGRLRFSEKSVGNQFFIAHPGRLGAAK